MFQQHLATLPQKLCYLLLPDPSVPRTNLYFSLYFLSIFPILLSTKDLL